MLTKEYKANKALKQPCPTVKCNALYKTKNNVNIYLTPSQAIELSRNILLKAQFILDKNIEDAGVQVWCQGANSEILGCGIDPLRKGPRRKKHNQESASN